jgi:hypothetical protein
MYVNWQPKSKTVSLYNDNGAIVRRFIARAEVVNAHVTGNGKDATIAITMTNGKTEIYKASGARIRSS